MSDYRFTVGTSVMCNFGQEGWKLGRIIALNYREETWARGHLRPLSGPVGREPLPHLRARR